MDKYTVDLDQVLNDFEYSELTDQQSKNAAAKPQGATALQPPPVTKHSINNVFHSLNEYLNSEISSSIEKVQLQAESLDYYQQSEGKSDNNLINTITESYKDVEVPNNEKTGLDVTNNQLTILNNSFESSGQNERLLKLKNEPQIIDILEKVENRPEKINNRDAFKNMQQGQVQEDTVDVSLLAKQLQPNLLELTVENPSSINNGNLDNIHHAPEIFYEGLNKTDVQNFSLLDTENIESELTPGLNCIENNIKSEVEIVYKECDKNIDNKADNTLNNEQTNFLKKESCFDINECKTGETMSSNVNNLRNIENKDNLFEKTEISDKNVYDENFVKEPSKSPYALGKDIVQNQKKSKSEVIAEAESIVNDLAESDENTAKLDCTLQNDENQKNLPDVQIIDYVIPPSEKLLGENNSAIKEKSLIEDTPTQMAENNPTSDEASPNYLEQKVIVGFCTELDIDESELNKMLEDLEIEEGSDFDQNITEEDDLKKTKSCMEANQESKIKDYNNDNIEVKSLVSDGGIRAIESDMVQIDKEKSELPEEITDSHKELSLKNTTDNEGSKNPFNESKEIIDNRPIECLEITKPSKSEGKSAKVEEKLESFNDHTKIAENSQETCNDAEEDGDTADFEKQPIEQQENVEDADKKTTIPLQQQQSHDSATRPQDLALKSEVKDENVTRKIDLIGSPGSTPYNNVYINKSIDPKTIQDTDSDYTSSASPTFSDCSTESTSTASTASVEDFPKHSDGTNKNPGHKHRHDKSGVKNIESGRGEPGEGDTGAGQGERNVQENSVSSSEQNQDSEGLGDAGLALNTEQNVYGMSRATGEESQERSPQPRETFLDKSWLGKEAPLWIPDADAASCLHCDMKFTVLKRRHHCRACGLVLCSKCCNLKFRLEYLDAEARVCTKCYDILNKDPNNPSELGHNTSDSGDSPAFRPNPNNPLEYCSTVSPLQQIGPAGAPPPSVMVPVGVLKRKGSNKKSNKSVMFCDGIAPGSDLTHLDQDFNYQETRTQNVKPQKDPEEVEKKAETPPAAPAAKSSRNQPKIDPDTSCFIPKTETSLPPTVSVNKTDTLYSECSNSPSVVEMLKNEALTFAINQNLFVQVKVINMSCCINKQAWCFSTEGLINVGSDEIVYLIEYIDEESFVPKDVFFHINNVYQDAVKGTSVKELGISLHNTSNFLDSKNHAGFVYIRPTFQCLENVLKPKEPYLIGILIHRWETPWAKLFPLRLILRLGAEYRYYPSPLISTRHRDSVFVEIGHTIINLLADFRNFTYTLPQIRGLIIHMEDKKTTITIPRNRYDQVMKSINNSSEHILAFAGNFSAEADSHLVCIQDTQGHENCYTTHAINIHNKPRKITGASFIVFNGSLKSSSGLTAKSNIVEDGLMIQIPSEHMDKIRDNLRTMKDHTIACGCINATSDETVNVVWGENDVDFNAGVQSPVDITDMKGIPSIRVHNGKDYFCNNGSRLIRWTEVFIIQSGEENPKNQDPVDISKVSESIAKACCTALVKYLDLLVSNSCQKIGIRVTLHVENVSYLAGSNGLKLPPIYMRSLDNELVPVLHRITSNNLGDNAIELELIFRILNA